MSVAAVECCNRVNLYITIESHFYVKHFQSWRFPYFFHTVTSSHMLKYLPMYEIHYVSDYSIIDTKCIYLNENVFLSF